MITSSKICHHQEMLCDPSNHEMYVKNIEISFGNAYSKNTIVINKMFEDRLNPNKYS